MSRSETKADRVDEMLVQWSDARPDLEPSGLGAALRIQRIAGILSGRLKQVLAPANLAPWEYDVLAALRRAGPLSPKELCHAAQLTSGAMTHRLDRLEERRLIRRRVSVEDRRSLRVSLTSAGRRLVDGILGERMGAADEALGSLSERELAQLSRLLRKVGRGLDD